MDFLNKKLLSGIILLLFAVLMSFLIIDGYLNLNRDIKIYSDDVVNSIDQRMSFILAEVNVFPQYMGNLPGYILPLIASHWMRLNVVV